MPHSFIKSAFTVIGPYILQIINCSIRDSIFPSAWKKLLVLALNTVAAPQTMNDTRTIVLLCFLSKILERLVHEKILAYVETRKLLDPYQAGYRKRHSTQTALLKLTDNVRAGMEKKHVSCCNCLISARHMTLCVTSNYSKSCRNWNLTNQR